MVTYNLSIARARLSEIVNAVYNGEIVYISSLGRNILLSRADTIDSAEPKWTRTIPPSDDSNVKECTIVEETKRTVTYKGNVPAQSSSGFGPMRKVVEDGSR